MNGVYMCVWFCLTLGHAQVRPHNQHELALLIARQIRGGGGRLLGGAEALAAVGLGGVGPVGRVIEHGVALVHVALVALDGVLVEVAALLAEAGGDEVALGGPDAEDEAADEGRERGAEDDGHRLRVVYGVHLLSSSSSSSSLSLGRDYRGERKGGEGRGEGSGRICWFTWGRRRESERVIDVDLKSGFFF